LHYLILGRESERVETLSDADIQSEVIQSLEEMFGESKIPIPAKVVITRWKANSLFNGSYSYYKVGSKPRHRTGLGKALGDRVFFAGEACHLYYPATAHGALMSGQATAAKVVKELED
jgi:monoamine oxidase